MAEEKSGVRGMSVEQTRSWSLLKFLRHIDKREDSTRDPNNQGVEHTSREPVPITYVWPRLSLEAVLADLRGNESTDLNPQQPEFPSSLPLSPPSKPRVAYRNFESKENSRSKSDDTLAPSLEDSSEEGDDSGDEDYIPEDGCKDQDTLEPRCRRSSRKRMIEEKYSPESPGLLLDSSKSTGSNVLVFRRSKICEGEEWSVVPFDEGQIAAKIPVSVSQGNPSGSRGKLRNSREKVASISNISSQVLSLNQNDWVGAKKDSVLFNSGNGTLSGIVLEEIEELQKRCQEAKQSLLRCKETYPGSPNSTYNLKSREKRHKLGIVEAESACPAQLEVKSAGPQGRLESA